VATISIARVIFCVFWTLAILTRISLPTAMGCSSGRGYQVCVCLNLAIASASSDSIESL
jgi:hypothetical protein